MAIKEVKNEKERWAAVEKITQKEIEKLIIMHGKYLQDNTKGKRLILIKKDLSKLDMRGSDMKGSDMSWSDMRGSNMRGSDMSWSNMSWSNMSGSNMSGSDMSGSDISECNLSLCITDDKYISISGIGSEKRMSIFNSTKNIIWCGCFKGNLKEFENKVKLTHKDNKQYLKEYLDVIQYFKSFVK